MGRLLKLALFFSVQVFALNLDSLPVWNPEFLLGKKVPTPIEIPEEKSLLETHGMKTMEVTVGDGGTEINQQLRLSINGFVGDSVLIEALLNDVDRPAGNQTTATLQEVDEIYFRASSKHWLLHLGDFNWENDALGLMRFERSSLGAMAGFNAGYTEVLGAWGIDETKRKIVVLKGVSGQREGYAISGTGEFIAIVPETEKVWLNGILLTRNSDYEVNYAGGLLNFKGRFAPSFEDEIRVEYDAYNDGEIYTMLGFKGKYRHPNLYLDVSGFRLENDKNRLKRSVWTDEDYALLKNDEGEVFNRDDSLENLSRPEKIDRIDARLQTQWDRRFYLDLELAFHQKDSNTVSHKVRGPEGRAFRYFATTDSSLDMKKFPVAFFFMGNHTDVEFEVDEYQGTDRSWDLFLLKDEWDLDTVVHSSEKLHYDELGLKINLGNGWFTQALWGYRQNEKSHWNSSRAKFDLIHKNKNAESEWSFVRVASFQNEKKERYQTLGHVIFLRGLVRPYANFDVRFTDVENSLFTQENFYSKSGGGIFMGGKTWEISEGLEVKFSELKNQKNAWEDSLKVVSWNQSARYENKNLKVDHFLQYENRNEKGEESDIWVGDFNGRYENEKKGIEARMGYKLGLTEEQTYTPIYKAVAAGTGDVRYDSLTGTFIEGVDNGNFVYEGMGRNDSLGAKLASNAVVDFDLKFKPGMFFNVKQGVLRDLILGGNYHSEGEDTTGKILYLPLFEKTQLEKISSGFFNFEFLVGIENEAFFSLYYKPGMRFEKKLSTQSYYEDAKYHEVETEIAFHENHLLGGNFTLEKSSLKALQNLDWNVYEIYGFYRFSFFEGFHLEPRGGFRKGDGTSENFYNFNAYLWDATLKFGYKHRVGFDGFVQLSAIHMERGENTIPYQMMKGYGQGETYRVQTSIALEINEYLSFALHYILRFGNSEENLFQKLTTEARAYF